MKLEAREFHEDLPGETPNLVNIGQQYRTHYTRRSECIFCCWQRHIQGVSRLVDITAGGDFLITSCSKVYKS